MLEDFLHTLLPQRFENSITDYINYHIGLGLLQEYRARAPNTILY